MFRLSFYITLISISTLAVLPDYSSLPPVISISDLLNHTTAFTVLFLLYRLAYDHTVKRIGITLILYGIGIEIVQAFLPTRSASVEDLLADCLGILFGWSIMKVIYPVMGQIRLKKS